jgi:hypothetical protein
MEWAFPANLQSSRSAQIATKSMEGSTTKRASHLLMREHVSAIGNTWADGPPCASKLQQHHVQTCGVLPPCPQGKTTPHPTDQTLGTSSVTTNSEETQSDLSEALKQWIDAGDEILLYIDAKRRYPDRLLEQPLPDRNAHD